MDQVRVPMLVRVPWIKESHGKHSDALIELVVRQTADCLPARPPCDAHSSCLSCQLQLSHDPLLTSATIDEGGLATHRPCQRPMRAGHLPDACFVGGHHSERDGLARGLRLLPRAAGRRPRASELADRGLLPVPPLHELDHGLATSIHAQQRRLLRPCCGPVHAHGAVGPHSQLALHVRAAMPAMRGLDRTIR
eukprot:COSAG01_NODE_4302_length_5160_cov_16.365936_5_plen_193_part_00